MMFAVSCGSPQEVLSETELLQDHCCSCCWNAEQEMFAETQLRYLMVVIHSDELIDVIVALSHSLHLYWIFASLAHCVGL